MDRDLLATERASRGVTTAPTLARLASLALVALAAAACSRPSADVDGGDLLGVFDAKRPLAAASASASASASAAPSLSASAAAPSARVPDDRPSVRVPTDGSCVAPSVVSTPPLRRTVGRPACRGTEVLEWRDAEGSPRYACVTAPPGAVLRAPLPLVIFFHGSDGDPSSVEKQTSLRRAASTVNLTGDPAHVGFVVLAPQGRAFAGVSGNTFDASGTTDANVDLATVDHFVGVLEERGLVDARRVYAVGNGTGGQMAASFAMIRSNQVAAFASYASAEPPVKWSCTTPPPPAFVAYRACDAVTSCESVERWVRARERGSAQTRGLRLGAGAKEELLCALRNKCSDRYGTALHARWPKPSEPEMLSFLAQHSLAVAPTAAIAHPKP